MNGNAPQSIKDWITGYDEMLYKSYRQGNFTMEEYGSRLKAMGQAARDYNITPDTGTLYLLSNAKGIKNVKHKAGPGKKTFTLDAHVPNRVGFYGPGAYTVVEGKWGRLDVEPLHTDYEVRILGSKLLVTVHKGSVKVRPPGKKPVVVKEKSSFLWDYQNKSGGGNRVPGGKLEQANCNIIRGWARDPDTKNSINVHIYADKAFGKDNFLTGFPAKQNRPGLPFADKRHGFQIKTPAKLKDGKPHRIYVYAIDGQGGKNAQLQGSPMQIKCEAPAKIGNNIDSRKAYQEYISAYNRLTDLMHQGKGDTPEAEKAYEEYKKAKARYEKSINKK